MESHPSKKSRNDPTADNVDLISNLPDDVISLILSRMPTVDAFATCILSKDWKYKWTATNTIDISDEFLNDKCTLTESVFTDFMDRMIILHTQNIRTIRLKLVHRYNSSLVKSWISILLRNKIESLDIDTCQTDLVIYVKHLNSTSLGELALNNLTFKILAWNCFANIKYLHLEELEIRNDSSNEVVSFTFPALERIKLIKCIWLDMKFVEIHAPTLKGFKSQTIIYNVVDHYKINIHCADHQLGLFEATGGELENIFVTGSKVVYATFENTTIGPLQGSGRQVRRLLEQFSSTLEELTISMQTLWTITGAEEGFHLPKFEKVRRLNLTNVQKVTFVLPVKSLFEILHVMPFLKCLAIDMLMWGNYDYDSTAAPVPQCIMSSLEEIELVKIDTHYRDSLGLIKFLLRTAMNLKRCHVYPRNEMKSTMEEISAYPTGSTSLEIIGHTTQIDESHVDPFDAAFDDVHEDDQHYLPLDMAFDDVHDLQMDDILAYFVEAFVDVHEDDQHYELDIIDQLFN